MNLIIKLLSLMTIFFSSFSATANIKFLTYNILHEETINGTPHHLCDIQVNCGIELWPNRKSHIRDFLRNQNADIFALQEDIQHQVQYLKESMIENYSEISYEDFPNNYQEAPGVIPWQAKGLHSIFYKRADFRVLKRGFFWLSDTPDTPSRTFAVTKRGSIVTWGKFYHYQTKKAFYVFNTHMPAWRECKSSFSRAKSINLIVNKIYNLNSENLPVILLGDMNLKWYKPKDQDVLRYITDSQHYTVDFRCDDDSGSFRLEMNYPSDMNKLKAAYGTGDCRPNNCTNIYSNNNNAKLDYIFTSKAVNILSKSVVGSTAYIGWRGMWWGWGMNYYLSDHAAVSATLNFSNYPEYNINLNLIDYDSHAVPIFN